MGVKEAPEVTGEPDSGSFAREPAASDREENHEGLRVVTLAPRTESEPDLGAALTRDAPQSDPYLGCTIDGRYKVEARLGEGGMGVVYRCTHKIIGKKVAMKVLRADLAKDTEATERFLNEAKAASSIGNPHIIDISDFGQFPDGSTYFVMEFLEGIPLSATVADTTPLPAERIIGIAAQLAEGLFAAHEAQIVHRDLKPDNIFLVSRGQNKDFVKILDFGIAKVSTAEGKLTRAGAVFGTPHYMSPEQAAGTPVDHRGDIYAFGVILYELVSGRVPFDADNFMGILTQHMYKSPLPFRALVPEPQQVPVGLEAIVRKCLSKRPAQRYESMNHLLADLQKLQAGEVPDAVADMLSRSDSFDVPRDYFAKHSAQGAVVPEGAARRMRRPLVVLAMIGGAALLAIVVAFATRSSESEPVDTTLPVREPAALGITNAVAPEPDSPDTIPSSVQRVVLAVEPIDAHAFQGEADLGQSPVFVEVPKDGSVDVEIRREGYQTQSITLDGSEGKRSIKLVKETRPDQATPAKGKLRPKSTPAGKPGPAKQERPAKQKRPATQKPSIGGSEIINPWG